MFLVRCNMEGNVTGSVKIDDYMDINGVFLDKDKRLAMETSSAEGLSYMYIDFDKDIRFIGFPSADKRKALIIPSLSSLAITSMIRDMIKNAAVKTDNSEILLIMESVLNDYFDGRKTLDELVNVLQDRVGKYVNENR